MTLLSKLYKHNHNVLIQDNITTLLINFKDLIHANIAIPNEQRITISDKISDIVKYQDLHFKTKKHFNFLGSININCCLEDNTNYLIDGQHRFAAVKQLFRMNYHREQIKIELVEVKTRREMIDNYKLLNKNTPLPEFPQGIDEDVAKKAFITLQNEFEGIWKTNKATRPFVNINNFQEAIGFMLLKINEHRTNQNLPPCTSNDLVHKIKYKNEQLKLWSLQLYEENIRRGVKWSRYKDIADKHHFFLGMYHATSEEHVYAWVENILEDEGIWDTKSKKSKRKIPIQRKRECWDLYIGPNLGLSHCYCCRTEKISKDSFECGHVLSEHNGGKINIENLRPVCRSCNSSMGTQHMLDYIKYVHPDNITLFNDNISPGSYNNVTQITPAKSMWSNLPMGGFF
jgi:hypothetical protein